MLLFRVNNQSFRLSKKSAKKLADDIYAKLYGHADEFIGDWILQNGLLARVQFRLRDKLFGYYLMHGVKNLFIWNTKGDCPDNTNFNLTRKMSGTAHYIPQEWEGNQAANGSLNFEWDGINGGL